MVRGGVAAVTNLILDPRATGSNWFNIISGSGNRTYNTSWNGKSNWSRITASNNMTARLSVNHTDLIAGETYMISFLAGNNTANVMSFNIDFCDGSNANFTLAAGEQRRISFTGTRHSYDNIYRFIDLNVGASASGLLITDGMMTRGATLHGYADGASTDWTWNGAANSSTSTGPPL